MPPRLYQVDAFTEVPFAGNPAAICLLDEPADVTWMQHLAQEMNLAETAYLLPEDDAWRLRWFTPVREVELCGHATLAAAHTLWEENILDRAEDARFNTRSGRLVAMYGADGIEMDFPSDRPVVKDPPAGLLEALGAEALRVARGRHYWLVELASETAVRQLEPDLVAVRDLNAEVIVTSRGDGGTFHFVSRFFAPSFGVDEDPVTGSAHCCLGPWWSRQLKRNELVGYQASSRGGIVRVRVEEERTFLTGRAITIFRGQFAPGALPAPATA
ncbi:MAG: PhzF family phenazine biosynthesis protein [Planctomycetota bacterium]|jgi:predicted PhzF superfamily epimerase YddE/YHI9